MLHTLSGVVGASICVVLLSCGAARHEQVPQSLGPCGPKFLGGDTKLESDDDKSGRDVEVWCRRRWFGLSSHYEVRAREVGPEAETPPLGAGRPLRFSRVVGGCFFGGGENSGPEIQRDPVKRTYISVIWTNTSPLTGKQYKFTYDWLTNKLKITSSGNRGGGVTTKEVDAPSNWDDLKKLLQDES